MLLYAHKYVFIIIIIIIIIIKIRFYNGLLWGHYNNLPKQQLECTELNQR